MKTFLMILLASLAACDREPSVARHEAALAEWPRAVEDPEPGALAVEVGRPELYPGEDDPADRDGDGFDAEVDHDDENPYVHPGAEEVPCNGVDEDGDTVDPCAPDVDGDGVRGDLDCDDLRADIRPLLPETRCNDVDENCDGVDDCDRDGDGHLDHYDLDPDDGTVNARINENPPHIEP